MTVKYSQDHRQCTWTRWAQSTSVTDGQTDGQIYDDWDCVMHSTTLYNHLHH